MCGPSGWVCATWPAPSDAPKLRTKESALKRQETSTRRCSSWENASMHWDTTSKPSETSQVLFIMIHKKFAHMHSMVVLQSFNVVSTRTSLNCWVKPSPLLCVCLLHPQAAAARSLQGEQADSLPAGLLLRPRQSLHDRQHQPVCLHVRRDPQRPQVLRCGAEGAGCLRTSFHQFIYSTGVSVNKITRLEV